MAYYTLLKTEDSSDCDWGKCTIYTVDGGPLGKVEIGIYHDPDADGVRRVSIMDEETYGLENGDA